MQTKTGPIGRALRYEPFITTFMINFLGRCNAQFDAPVVIQLLMLVLPASTKQSIHPAYCSSLCRLVWSRFRSTRGNARAPLHHVAGCIFLHTSISTTLLLLHRPLLHITLFRALFYCRTIYQNQFASNELCAHILYFASHLRRSGPVLVLRKIVR